MAEPAPGLRVNGMLLPAILDAGGLPDKDNFGETDARHYASAEHLYYLSPISTQAPASLWNKRTAHIVHAGSGCLRTKIENYLSRSKTLPSMLFSCSRPARSFFRTKRSKCPQCLLFVIGKLCWNFNTNNNIQVARPSVDLHQAFPSHGCGM